MHQFIAPQHNAHHFGAVALNSGLHILAETTGIEVMGRITELLNTAHARSEAQNWPYIGALLPHEAHELLLLAPGARLIDVRSRAELELTGTLPGAVHVEWQAWPGWTPNPHFAVQLAQAVDPESLLFFICRCGHRSHRAAIAGTLAGLRQCYNVQEGFEGDLDKNTGRRNALNGWKQRGLPWVQS
jgi:rhodanese-related sulfurtransferase